jgi:hypothetical protein
VNATAKKSWGTAPFFVDLVAVVVLCKAAFLLGFGAIGIAAQSAVSESWGEGMIVLGLIFLVLGWLLPSGNRIVRDLVAAISVISLVIAIVWVLHAHRSAVIEALVMLGFAVLVVVLLFVPENVKAYFRKT